MPKKGEYGKFKNYERKIKSPFMIYFHFESILVSEDNKKQNTNESYTKKYQKHVAYSYDYKLPCVGDKFSKPFKSYLGEDPVYNNMVEESKYCSHMIKIYFNKELIITKKDHEDFKNSAKCWICDDDYVAGNVSVRDDCHITGKYTGSTERDWNLN